MFLIMCLSVYYDYMLSRVRVSLYSSMESYSAQSKISWVSGEHSVSVVHLVFLRLHPIFWAMWSIVDVKDLLSPLYSTPRV